MNNEIWKKTAAFLKELRCENIGRNSYIELPEYKEALKEKTESEKNIDEILSQLDEKGRLCIQEYINKTEICAEEENQQAYLQGMQDMLMILSGAGILKTSADVSKWIQKLK